MVFWNRFFKKKEKAIKEKIEIKLNLDELEERVKESIKQVNDIGDEHYADSVINSLNNVKTAIENLMKKEPVSEYNKALLIGANNARQRIKDQLLPLTELKNPIDLISINEFIKGAEKLLGRAARLSEQSGHAQLVFRSEMNDLSDSFDELSALVGELREAVSERNAQLNSLFDLLDNIKSVREAIKRMNEIKVEELSLRKRISSYERDKTFLSSEVSRIKGLAFYNELLNSETILKNINSAKLKLESEADDIVSTFSKALRKEFRDNKIINDFLTNPLLTMVNNEQLIKKELRKLLKDVKSGNLKLNDQEKAKLVKVLTKNMLNDLLEKYKELLNNEKEIKSKDFTLLRQATAFEKRLIELNSKINNEVKKLDSFNEKLKQAENEVEAIKTKTEAIASEYYPEKVIILL